MTAFKTLDDFDLTDKRVLLRVDLNVPVKDGKVTDKTRIERVALTIQEIANKGGLPILLAHFDRPKGKVVPEMSLQIIVPVLKEIVGKPVVFAETDWNDISGVKAAIASAEPGSVILVENTRFHPGEEKNDPELIARMASLGDIYINDAFSATHRAHASTEGLARALPSGAGRAMEAELIALEAGLGNPKKPVIAIVGGAKVSTKIDLLENLVTRVEALVIGGGMANTFIYALGYDVGKSLCERDLKDTALRIMDKAEDARCAIILPIDGVVGWHFEANTPSRVYGLDAIDKDGMVLDAGPQSVEKIKTALNEAKTVVWNGPLGAFEIAPFDTATVEIAKYAAERTRKGLLTSVAGGGDTVAALAHAGVKDNFTYVSTAGGAFLEWMEGKPLPGVDALKVGTA
jgi:phosphoglycerate kinase